MLKYIDLNFYANEDTELLPLIRRYKTSFGYIPYLDKDIKAEVILHLNQEEELLHEGIKYKGFKGKGSFFHIPFQTLHYIKKQRPDVILVQGLVFPLQLIALRLFLGRQVKILVQHHGEAPFVRLSKRMLQKVTDRFTNGYLFTSAGNAAQWIAQAVIENKNKCHEVPEASTYFSRQDKMQSRYRLKINEDKVFLWVGRLIKGKDPLCILEGFEQYLKEGEKACLYMIYQDDTMLADVKHTIEGSSLLKNAVVLVGKVPYEELPYWYSAADYFVSGSHKEGSGYALIESMACGCIPVVTDIPPFLSLTAGGKYGFTFHTGNSHSFYEALCSLNDIDANAVSADIQQFFHSDLSFDSIARRISHICHQFATE